MIDWSDATIRLIAATILGGAIGFDRELRGKATGVRTMAIVALGSALVSVVGVHLGGNDPSAAGRIIQGVLTGIGFLGAGVILRNSAEKRVRGLTTAASIWLTACIGLACGFGAWTVVMTATGLGIIILVFGKPFERAIGARHHHHQHKDHGPEKDQGADRTAPPPPPNANAHPTA